MTSSFADYHAADFEPSFVSGRTYVTRLRVGRIDAAALLSLTIALVLLVPFRYVLPGLTGIGRPGLVMGMLLFLWWTLARFTPTLSMTGPQPMRWALMGLLVSALISYAVGFMRGLTSIEANNSDRTILVYGIFAGIMLTAADGIPNWIRLRGVLKVLVVCGAIIGAIGIAQYVTKIDVTQYIIIPGLQAHWDALGFEARGGGVRVASTTTHYIEFAATMSLILPFALSFALHAGTKRRRMIAAIAAVMLAGGNAVTISRTGILAVLLMLIVLIPIWTWRTRYNILVMAGAMLAVIGGASPGLLRTLTNLFDSPDSNPAFTVRADRYPLAFHYINQRPWFGRGTGTWVPPQYQILDNQWLATLIQNGYVGAAALALLHLTGIVLAFLAFRRSSTPEDKHLCAALISTQLIAIVVAGTFDSWAFSTYTMILALTCGMCGTVWRLTHPAREVRTSTTRWFLDNNKTPTR
ncbi:O-antigen ligase family protein [Dactylosporangium sp. CA-139066]|uniref:O-antigen ligase family protein n=1 Tax=Dactylosporangium sp. CA-139066 TaxID=3239930 RepID=UPI003D8AB821